MDTKQVYDDNAVHWCRKEPDSLSDFTARPFVFDSIGSLEGESVLDLGCGEGYCARKLKSMGAGDVLGIDISDEMIKTARLQEQADLYGIEYRVADVRDLSLKTSFDVCIAIFLFNYLDAEGMFQVMQKVRRLVKPGGKFVFSVPHPFFPFIDKQRSRPFYFDSPTENYFDAADKKLEGKIWKKSGEPLHVQCVHKTFDTYFECMRRAGFDALPMVKELTVTESHLKIDQEFFGPLAGQPLHVLFSVEL